MRYTELRDKHQQEFNRFPLGFAFSKEQFNEMMGKWRLDPVNDLDKIARIIDDCLAIIAEAEKKRYNNNRCRFCFNRFLYQEVS